jgi:hypothetical protein
MLDTVQPPYSITCLLTALILLVPGMGASTALPAG